MDQRGLTSLDRVCLIVIAVIFYLAIRSLQGAQDDISAIARNYENANDRLTRIEETISGLEKFIGE